MIQLRPYQQSLIQSILDAFKDGLKHIILQAPTGSGKTIIFTEIARRVARKNNKVLILTDRAELLQQTGGALNIIDLNAFYIEAGCRHVNNNFNVYLGMSQTFRRRIQQKYWKDFLASVNLIIIDELHKQEFNYLFESGLVDSHHIIGCTATPLRSGKMRQLGLDYEKIISQVSVQDLINKAYLVGDDLYGFEPPDMSEVQIDRMKGDYQQNQMFQKFNNPKRYSGVVKNFTEICPGSKALCFCVNIEHTIRTTLEFIHAGYDARFISSKLNKPKEPAPNAPEGQWERYRDRLRVYELYQKYYSLYSGLRKPLIQDFRDSRYQILVNAEIATTGFDVPDIETIIINRATTSLTLWLQMLGRGSRIAGGKTHFNILDFGGNAQRLGGYTDERQWSLWHEESSGEGLPPIKECGYDSDGKPINTNGRKGCRRLIHAGYNICPFCGFHYPSKSIEEVDLETIMYNNQIQFKTKRIRDMSVEELIGYWKEKGHKTPWLWRQLWINGEERAIKEAAKQEGWRQGTVQKAVGFCKKQLVRN